MGFVEILDFTCIYQNAQVGRYTLSSTGSTHYTNTPMQYMTVKMLFSDIFFKYYSNFWSNL